MNKPTPTTVGRVIDPTPSIDRELTPLDSARLGGPYVPERLRIAPWGRVDSTSGTFVVDDEAARLVLEAFAEHGTDLPIDYEHQTLGGSYSSPTGQAPAAGWIKRLEVDPGEGIFAVVEWTEPAREQLAAKQYRYLSPVALVRKDDRKLIALHSVALTNKPAIVGAEPIVNRHTDADDASVEDALQSLRDALRLNGDAGVDTVLIAANRRLDELDRNRALREAEDRVRRAVRAGRVTAAQRDFAIQLALQDGQLFDRWLQCAPVVVPLGRIGRLENVEPVAANHRVVARAQAEFRAHPQLAALTSERAFIDDALRQEGIQS